MMGVLITLCVIQFIAGGVAILVIQRKYQAARRQLDSNDASLEELRSEWMDQKRRLEAELYSMKSELSSLSLHYIQKIELVHEFRKKVEAFRKSIPKELSSNFNRIIDGISTLEELDKEWNNFRNYFNDLNFGFFDQLRSQCPNLSSKDLKFCALIRLNLETKQIATIMGVSPGSAKVTRHRIRKKLGLSRDDSIHDFLNRFSSMN